MVAQKTNPNKFLAKNLPKENLLMCITLMVILEDKWRDARCSPMAACFQNVLFFVNWSKLKTSVRTWRKSSWLDWLIWRTAEMQLYCSSAWWKLLRNEETSKWLVWFTNYLFIYLFIYHYSNLSYWGLSAGVVSNKSNNRNEKKAKLK